SPLRVGRERIATAPSARGDQSKTGRIERRPCGFYQCFSVPAPKTTERPASQWNFYRFGHCSARVSRKHDCSGDDARPEPLSHSEPGRLSGLRSLLMVVTKLECRDESRKYPHSPGKFFRSLTPKAFASCSLAFIRDSDFVIFLSCQKNACYFSISMER